MPAAASNTPAGARSIWPSGPMQSSGRCRRLRRARHCATASPTPSNGGAERGTRSPPSAILSGGAGVGIRARGLSARPVGALSAGRRRQGVLHDSRYADVRPGARRPPGAVDYIGADRSRGVAAVGAGGGDRLLRGPIALLEEWHMDLSMTHILILLVIALLVFGARRIPEIGSSLGQGIREFKKSLKEVASDQPQPPLPPAPPTNTSSLPPSSGGEPKRLNQ